MDSIATRDFAASMAMATNARTWLPMCASTATLYANMATQMREWPGWGENPYNRSRAQSSISTETPCCR
jgi:hypothetical protein